MKDITLWKCDICGTEYRDKKTVSEMRKQSQKRRKDC